MRLREIEYNIDVSLGKMNHITLDEMGSVKLMNRVDTKYVVHLSTLCTILRRSVGLYRVQIINDEARQAYFTTYLDTCNLDMYMTHHNGHKSREKIRVRTYLNSGSTFLEVKNKSNKGRTDKKRIEVESVERVYNSRVFNFLSNVAKYNLDEIIPVLSNKFRRITLVNHAMTERLTIDTDIVFSNLLTDLSASLDEIAIIEVKRDERVESPIMKILSDLRVKQMGFSKYCIGTAMTNNNIRKNRFKQRLHCIDKLKGIIIN